MCLTDCWNIGLCFSIEVGERLVIGKSRLLECLEIIIRGVLGISLVDLVDS